MTDTAEQGREQGQGQRQGQGQGQGRARRRDGGVDGVSGTATAPEDGAAQEGEAAREGEAERFARAWRRRVAAVRDARRVLARPGARATLRQRLAVLDRAAEVYDLDEPADLYGNGVVEALEERVAALLGTESAVFFPTGTMAQQVALRCWAGRTGNPVVALHALSHPEVHERNALSLVGGLRPVRVTGAARPPTADEVRGFEEPFGTLMLELPLRDAGYALPSWDELTEVVAAARERDAVVHFDGAGCGRPPCTSGGRWRRSRAWRTASTCRSTSPSTPSAAPRSPGRGS